MAGPAVEVIVFTHAPFAKYLRGCLRSLLAQSYSSLQISLIGDDSREIASVAGEFQRERNVALLSERDLLERSPVKNCRRAFLQAANVRMKESSAVYVGTWNCDDSYNRDHVKLLVDVLEKYPTTGAAFDKVDYRDDWDENGSEACDGVDFPAALMISPDRARKLESAEVALVDLFVENLMTGPSSLIRRSVLERVGGYDKDTVLNCDLHWFYRIAAYFPVRFVNYTGVRKRIHPGNTTAVDSHHVFGVSDLENLRDYYPEVCDRIGKNVFNKKLGRKYFRLGLYYEKSGQLGKAQEAYKKAMQLRKLSLRYGWQYYRSTLFSTAVG